MRRRLDRAHDPRGRTTTVAAVSYLNALPLVDGLADAPGLELVCDVPSRLLATLVEDRATLALVPTIDYQLAENELAIVPAGAIASRGETLTVRLFSPRPLAEVERVLVDRESHTSVALLGVVLAERWGRRPRVEPFNPAGVVDDDGAARLLIGDKVVHSAPDEERYPFQLDLGREWHELTGLPFVFALWMARPSTELGDLPTVLAERLERNLERVDAIVAANAARLGWPEALARRYLGELLHYQVGAAELAAVERFWRSCHELGMLDRVRPLTLHRSGSRSFVNREAARAVPS